ncbi:thioesterase family protein [Psychrobacter sp. FDAARGOS_221]|uniref:thioesterase family protein n=1 Tax=Psychrobacter sp. FDAARGOS_221 TaxID=1975705 RepID=UPI000BB59341|nr:thioesterase family protein [Psychrobacter sp. FDAARGOS_221]PNK60186.1 thioesterase family protein [Psychrobacter sp. FDAARGOS_221]
MTSYYQCIERSYTEDGSCIAQYQPTEHAQGAWNDHEQHMAPATGILAHELTLFSPKPNLRMARLSLDILGLIPLEPFTITTCIIRPGRTIELVEAVMSHGGRDCIIARAWRLLTQDSSDVAGLEDVTLSQAPESLPAWEGMKVWPGGFIKSISVVADPKRRPGKGVVWISSDLDMVEAENTTDLVRIMGLVDTANGVVPRSAVAMSEMSWGFPNTDLQIHMHRLPQGKWLGIEAVQQYGKDGIGLTSAILHDTKGPFGRSEQILTLRPMS